MNDEMLLTPKKGKQFGDRAKRISSDEVQSVFSELKNYFHPYYSKFELAKALPSKMMHGDVDIVVLKRGEDTLKNIVSVLTDLGKVKDTNFNGPMVSVLYSSSSIEKDVHVDFISSDAEQFEANLMYLSFNDFSGILGVVSRKSGYNYGSTGFYKIFVDKKNQFHYIRLTGDLRVGLCILGYAPILDTYDKINTLDDVVKFIGYTDLFDSKYMDGCDTNHGDRKRMRAARPSAQAIKNGLIDLNKSRVQPDDDFFLKTLYPEIYDDYVAKCKLINETEHFKPKYNGKWLLEKYPHMSPGPVVGAVLNRLKREFPGDMDSVPESDILRITNHFLESI